MKKQNFFATTIFALSLSVIFTASTALAAETVYVSATGKYVVDGVEYEAYTNLQEAITAAGANGTVWIEDGFVCDTGSALSSEDGTASRLKLTDAVKGVTLRSRSGKWETGAEIRGAWHSAEAPDMGWAVYKLRGFRIILK